MREGEHDKMADCINCNRETKYECIRCKRKVCNMCSIPETDDSLPGWVVGKAVAYCSNCCNNQSEFDSENKDDTFLDSINKSSSESDKDERPTKR